MFELTQYQIDGIVAWLTLLAWLVTVTLCMGKILMRGFSDEYPWPEWARIRRTRRTKH